MDCEQIREQLEAYVLGALDPQEHAELQAHVADCPDCRQLVRELADTAGVLPQTLAAASPLRLPPAIKDSLLQKLAQESATEPQPGEPSSPQPAAEPPTALRSTINGNLNQPGPGRASRLWAGWGPSRVVAVAALMLLLIVAVALGARLSTALAEGRTLQSQLANLFDQQEVVLEVVDSEHTVKRVLLAPEPRPDSPLPSYGKLYTRSDLPHVVAMVARLPDPPAGQAYHLWLTAQGQTSLAGTLKINEQGFGILVFDAATDGPVYDKAELTLQPSGSTLPSGDVILTWAAE